MKIIRIDLPIDLDKIHIGVIESYNDNESIKKMRDNRKIVNG